MKNREMPVIVGVGQVSEKEFDLESSSPVALMAKAVANSLVDAGLSVDTMAEVDTLAVVKSFRGQPKFS